VERLNRQRRCKPIRQRIEVAPHRRESLLELEGDVDRAPQVRVQQLLPCSKLQQRRRRTCEMLPVDGIVGEQFDEMLFDARLRARELDALERANECDARAQVTATRTSSMIASTSAGAVAKSVLGMARRTGIDRAILPRRSNSIADSSPSGDTFV